MRRTICIHGMDPKMSAFSLLNRFKVQSASLLILAVCSQGFVLAQEEESKSSSLFSGGLVQQLRSLTKDAFESRDSESRGPESRSSHNFGRTNTKRKRTGKALLDRRTPPPAEEIRSPVSQTQRRTPTTQQRTTYIPQARTQSRTTTRSGIGSLPRENASTQPRTQVPKLLLRDESPRDRQLPEVITPEQMLGEDQPADGSEYELVHVETRLPMDVRDSIRSDDSGARLENDDTNTYETAAANDGRDGYGIGSLLSENKKSTTSTRGVRTQKKSSSSYSQTTSRQLSSSALEPNQVPKVSRVPLPGTTAKKSTSTKRSQTVDGEYSSRQPRTVTRKAPKESAPEKVATTLPAERKKQNSIRSPNADSSFGSQGAVSVPTKLANRPTSERPRQTQSSLPTLPRDNDGAPRQPSGSLQPNSLTSQDPAPSVQRLPLPSNKAQQAIPAPNTGKVDSLASGSNGYPLPHLPSNANGNYSGSKAQPNSGFATQTPAPLASEPSSSIPGRIVSGPSIQNESRTKATNSGLSSDATSGPTSGATPVPSQTVKNSMRTQQGTQRLGSVNNGGNLRRQTTTARPLTRNTPSSDYGERLKMLTPRLQVTFNGPQDLPVGEPANYQLEVLNDDRINLNGLLLRMDVPKGVSVAKSQPNQGSISAEKGADGSTMLTWQFDALASGQKAIAPMQLTAESPRNFAVAMEWTVMPITGDAALKVRSPRLEMALEGPSEVTFGQANTYRLHLRNAGDAPAENVQVNLTAGEYGSSSTNAGTIAPGQQEVVDIELTFNQKGSIQIEAKANASGNLSSQTKIGVLVRKPELSVQVEAPSLVYHGNATKYLVQVRNSGDAPASNVQASLQLPAGAKPASLPPGARLNGQQVNWPISDLPAGEAKNYEFAINLQSEGANVAQVTCADASGTSAKSSCQTELKAVADLKLLVSDPIAPAPVGSEVVYEMQITNRGSKAASDVRVIAQFSEGIEPRRGEGHGHRIVPGQVFFDPISTIGPGATLKLRVVAVASKSGTHRFRSEVRSSGTEIKLVQEESTEYLQTNSKIAAPHGGKIYR